MISTRYKSLILATDWWRQQDPVFSIADPISIFSRAGSAYRHYPIGSIRRLESFGSDILRCSWQKSAAGIWIRGAHLEPGRTNYVLHNTEIENAYWSKDGCTIADNSIVLPDGNISTYDILHEDASTGNHRIYKSVTGLPAGMIVLSIYVYPLGRTGFQLGGSANFCFFDLSTKTVYSTSGGVIDADVIDLKNGWCRVWWSTLQTAPGSHWMHLLSLKNWNNSYQGEDLDSIICWGMQLENGEYPSSLIITEGSVVSRTADSTWQVDGPLPDAQQGWISGKIYITPHQNSVEIPILTLSDGGSAADRIRLTINTSGQLEAQSAATGGDSGLVVGTNIMDGRPEGHHWHMTYRPGELCLAVDGTWGTTDHSVTIPSNLDRFELHPSGAIVGDLQVGNCFKRTPSRFQVTA